MNFLRNFFLAVGVLWTLSALAILIFKLNFQPKEIILTLIFPLAWALVKLFEKGKTDDLKHEFSDH